jgi:hypothetical protein
MIRLDAIGEARTKVLPPAAHRLVVHGNATLGQQFFDVAEVQLKPEKPAYGATDDNCRKAMAVAGRFRLFHQHIFRARPTNVSILCSSISAGQFQLSKYASWLRRCAFLPLPTIRLCRRLDSDRQIGFATSIPPFSTLQDLKIGVTKNSSINRPLLPSILKCFFGSAPHVARALFQNDSHADRRPDYGAAVVGSLPANHRFRRRRHSRL